ncbi:MAG: Mur ligase family protein [bacterium]|nr:Mur ligase family protein [bacterium]
MKNLFKKIITSILIFISKLILWKYKPKIVAITGSVGKTSTKDAVFAVLSRFTYVRKTDKSYNSEIGLPLTVLGVPNGWDDPIVWFRNILKGLWLFVWPHKYPKWLILEVGVGKPGDMARTASWLKTDVVIITAIGETPVHIEFFESKKHLVEEKAGLIKTLKKDGILVLNADDQIVLDMKNKTKNRIVTYGFDGEVDVKANNMNILYSDNNELKGIIYRLDSGGSSLPVLLEGVFGKNYIYASLATLALAYGLKMPLIESIDALKNYGISQGRMCLLVGINHSLIIDDTYNSSPFACEAALRTLGEVKSNGRKIAVLGDMLELGRHTDDAHKDVGILAKHNTDVLVTVGPRAKNIKDGAKGEGMDINNIFEFNNAREAGVFLKDFIKEGDLILVKGSQGMRMERTVECILEDQANKKNLLVRQDREWLKKV